jgi:hypothetical protein
VLMSFICSISDAFVKSTDLMANETT